MRKRSKRSLVSKQQGSVRTIGELRDRTAVSVKRKKDSKQNSYVGLMIEDNRIGSVDGGKVGTVGKSSIKRQKIKKIILSMCLRNKFCNINGLGEPSCLHRCSRMYSIWLCKGRILGRNWDPSLKSFPPCYSCIPSCTFWILCNQESWNKHIYFKKISTMYQRGNCPFSNLKI